MSKLSKTHLYKGEYYGPDTEGDIPAPVQEADDRLTGRSGGTAGKAAQTKGNPKAEVPRQARDNAEAGVVMLADADDFPHRNVLMEQGILTVQQAQATPDHVLLGYSGIGEAGLNSIKGYVTADDESGNEQTKKASKGKKGT